MGYTTNPTAIGIIVPTRVCRNVCFFNFILDQLTSTIINNRGKTIMPNIKMRPLQKGNFYPISLPFSNLGSEFGRLDLNSNINCHSSKVSKCFYLQIKKKSTINVHSLIKNTLYNTILK